MTAPLPTAFITGVGPDNIGLAAARALAARGHALIVADLAGVSDALVATLKAAGAPTVRALPLDVTDTAAVTATTARLFDETPDLGILVNSAGIARPTKPLAITPEEFDLVFAVNLRGTFFCCQAFIERLIAAGRGGAIVNLASMAGKTGGKHNGLHYAASKAGIISITKGFARAFGPHGIRVNAVAPGIIDTEMSRKVPGSDDQARAAPLGRWGTADEVGSVVAFLCGPDSAYMTGAVVDVNGGIL